MSPAITLYPYQITEDMIERYYTFNTKRCPEELIFGDFNDQPIPSNYHNFLNDDNDNGNNIPGTPVVLGPAQDVPYALILMYVSKIIYLS